MMTIVSELLDDLRFILRFRKQHVRQQKRLDQHAPKAGDLAPDFTLSNVSGTTSVTLSDFRGKKPVVLVFGSYT
jgi:peroxiredoxin